MQKKNETVNIKNFIFLGSRPLKNDEYPIFIRVTVNGQYEQASIKRSIDKKIWNQAKGCSKGRDQTATELNNYIEQLKTGVNTFHKELILTEGYISPKTLIQRLFTREEKRTVLTIMQKEIDRMESLIGIDYEYVTINRYKNCLRSVATTIMKFYDKEDVTFHELSSDFIRALEDHLKIEKQLKQSTIVRYMKCFKKISNMAFNNGWMKVNPFAGLYFRQPKTDPAFLTKEELNLIESLQLGSENMNIARIYLFSAVLRT